MSKLMMALAVAGILLSVSGGLRAADRPVKSSLKIEQLATNGDCDNDKDKDSE